jgi:Putative peptidoglycan binding domain
MEWLIVLTGIALVVYVFGVPSAHTRRMADPVAAGAARGARRATYRYFRRRDWAWRVVGVLAVLIFLFWIFGDDDTPAPATETAETTETAEAAPTTEGVSSPLNVGDRGADVAILQERLAAAGLPVTVDGVYGQETADAVMAFQEREQLTVDGVVASETGEALGIWSG